MKKKRYSLVGQDGNAFFLMGYTSNALEDAREAFPDNPSFSEKAEEDVMADAMSSDYRHLIAVLSKKIQEINEAFGF